MNDDRRSRGPATAAEANRARERVDVTAQQDGWTAGRDVAAMLPGFALVAFALLATGGFGSWWAHVLIVALGYAAMATHRPSARAAWHRP